MTIPEVFPFARFRVVAVSACLLLALDLSSSPVAAKAHKPPRHAIIFGTVWGPDDHELPGMEVKIRLATKKKAGWDLVSDRLGEFEAAVPAGPADYVLWAETKHYKLADGRHLQPSPEVTVHVYSDERVDTGLHLK